MTALRRMMGPALTGIFLLGFWYALRPLTGLSRFALPWPHEVARAVAAEWPSLLESALQTLTTAGAGFLLALVCGVLLALLLGSSRMLRRSLFPWVVVLQMVPLVVMVPLIVLWMEGVGGVILITFLMCLFPIVASTTQGLVSTPAELVELFRLHKATRLQELLALRLPAALPYALTGAQIAATLAVVGALTGEIFAGTVVGGKGGLGFQVILYRSEGYTAAMVAAGLLACLLGFFFVGAIHLLRWRLLHKWHESALDNS